MAAVAWRLWGEPTCRIGGEPAQARTTGAGGGARERTDGAEATKSSAWIATGAARVKRSALACDLNVWTIRGGALCMDIWQGVSRAR